MTDEKAQHTPGPWEWTPDFETVDGRETWSLVNADGWGILSCDGVENSPQVATSIHDARLIAAAPDLLAALVEIRQVARDNDTHSHRMRISMLADAAIAKAKGQAGES